MVLVEKVKCAQRTSADWKDSWRKTCDREAMGVYDPLRHDDDFLARFLKDNGIEIEVPTSSKTRAPHAPGPVPVDQTQPMSSRSVLWGATESLVMQVKKAQRSSEELKKAWHSMCDADGNGVRDPARHDASFLLWYLKSISPSEQEATGGR